MDRQKAKCERHEFASWQFQCKATLLKEKKWAFIAEREASSTAEILDLTKKFENEKDEKIRADLLQNLNTLMDTAQEVMGTI
jgi:hypothetical protein